MALDTETRLSCDPARIAAQVMDGEAVVINLSNGLYYRIAGAGGWIWSMLEQGSSIGETAARMAEHYGLQPDEVSKDLEQLAQALIAEDLLYIDETGSTSSVPGAEAAEAPSTYAMPGLEKFSDMEEMFALDPPLPGLANPPSDRADG